MSEYRAIRAKYGLLEICRHSELAAEITLQPVARLGVDAAILFTDLLLPLIPMGIQLEFAAGEGPVIYNPVRDIKDIEALKVVDPQTDLADPLETVRIVRREINDRVALIGFAGAPFTLASYIIEGGSSRNFLKTKRLMYENSAAWHQLAQKLAVVIAGYLKAQVGAGIQVFQLFDSWVGALTPEDYRQFVLPHTQYIFQDLRSTGVPGIHFGTHTASLLKAMSEAGGDVIGLDWQTPLDWGWAQLDHNKAIQGNLDPVALFAGKKDLKHRVERILDQAGGRPGHIFNLGHGILPETPVENVRQVVEWVHEITRTGK